MKTKFNVMLTLLLAFVVQISFAQEKTVSGTVTDNSDIPLPGVSVSVEGTDRGTQTDFNGEYSIQASPSEILVFEYIGLKTVKMTVGNQSEINVSLEPGEELDEVLVVGYGTSTKESFVGSAKQVSGETLSSKNFSNISQSLAGEAAGVTVINTSGQPGTTSLVRIRGFGSVNGNRAPLYVVDGVPFSGSINSINPNDIKNTVILKDATATAIYGSRGANGVILIETKTGSSEQDFIEVDLRSGINTQMIPRYDVMRSPEEYIGTVWEGLYNRGIANGLPEGLALNQANNQLFSDNVVPAGYNMWQEDDVSQLIDPATRMVREGIERKYTPKRYADEAFSSSIRNEANLRLGGGTQKTRYFLSAGLLDDEGYAINTGYKRYTTRANVQSNIKDFLDVQANIGYAYSETIRNGQTDGAENLFEFADKMAPIFPVFLRDDDGNLVADPIFGGNQYDYGTPSGFRARPNANLLNPIGSAMYDFAGNDRHEVNGSFKVDVKITDYLKFETSFGAQYSNTITRNALNPFYGTAEEQGGELTLSNQQRLTTNALQLLRFNKRFGDHSFEALVAHESNTFDFNIHSSRKALAVIPDLYELSNYLENLRQPFGYTTRRSLESYFGQVNYNFDQKYFFSGSVRRDGSSRFAKDKWGTFGSVGASWVMSKEDFLFDNEYVDFLKVKTSWGITGDEAGVGFYTGLDTYNPLNLGGNYAFSIREVQDPSLTWETAYMFQTGVESSLFGFLDVNLDYYIKDTQNLIFNRRLPISTGVSTVTVNDGVLRNKGFEFDIAAQVVETQDFGVSVSLNGETFQNELTTMPIDPSTGEEALLNRNGRFGYTEGGSIYDYYMREYAGVDPADGAPMWFQYYDANNPNEFIQSMTPYLDENPDAVVERRITKTYSEATDKFVGKSAIPDVRGAFRINARYKNFTLSTQFTYQVGGYGYDSQYSELMTDRFGAAGNNFHTDMRDRWQQPGDITSVPRLADALDANSASTSTRFLTKTDYLALNNFSVSYNFPKDIIESVGMSGLNLYLTGDNIFVSSAREGFLPNTSQSGFSGRALYAPLTSFTLGVNCKF